MQKLTSATDKPKVEQELVQIDNLVFNKFAEKFNDKYNKALLGEQKSLLNKYVFSFSDNAAEFKAYLNEELIRLRESLNGSLSLAEIRQDKGMIESTKRVVSLIESFKEKKIERSDIQKILEIQELVGEIEK